MKKALFILGIALAALAVSCNREDMKTIENNIFEGDTAYMVVSIQNVGGTGTKATSGGYRNGSEAEYAVTSADFYFYDEDGIYAASASAWNGGDPVTGNTNIEYDGNTVITLTGLTGTNYPSWVVTILNKPTDFKAPETLEEFAELLSDEDEVGIMIGTNTNFVMSTSSYVSDDNKYASLNNGNNYYFATPVVEDNFSLEALVEDATSKYGWVDANGEDIQPIEIYVERLSAKVTVVVDEELADTEVEGLGYLLASDVDGESENLYISLDAWALNATARHSNMVKAIDDTWENTAASLGTGWTWNVPTDFRSYWGKCYFYGLGYGEGEYPTTGSQGNYDDDEAGEGDDDPLSDYLLYTSLGDNATVYEIGDDEYCAENTNTAEIAAIPSALTSVLIKATVKDANGDGVDLVRHGEKLYTPNGYLDYVLEHLPEVYTRTGDGTETPYDYTKIDNTYLVWKNIYDGYVEVHFDVDTYGEYTFYSIDTAGNELQTYTAAELEAYLVTYNTNIGYDANYFTGGAMYYNIAIEHLRNNGTGDDAIYEANYGVVRNHWYYLTVTSLENLGKGVYDPDEVIVPLPEEPTYTLAARIHILSWNRVNQDVSL